MRPRRVLATFCFALISAALAAQEARQYEKVLLPIAAYVPIPGAFRSLWETSLRIRNDASVFAHVFGFDRNCSIPECPTEQVSPIRTGATIHPRVAGLPRVHADRVAFSLRLRDLSRQAESWGTEVPIVRERDFRSDAFSLIDLPISAGFRHVLRIYEFDGEDVRDARVRVSVYRLDPSQVTGDGTPPPDPFLGTEEYGLQFAPPSVARAFYPGYVAISDLSEIASLEGSNRIAIRIEPVSASLRLWGFVTVVNNETQHTTFITPQ